jgi:hypothetical protein
VSSDDERFNPQADPDLLDDVKVSVLAGILLGCPDWVRFDPITSDSHFSLLMEAADDGWVDRRKRLVREACKRIQAIRFGEYQEPREKESDFSIDLGLPWTSKVENLNGMDVVKVRNRRQEVVAHFAWRTGVVEKLIPLINGFETILRERDRLREAIWPGLPPWSPTPEEPQQNFYEASAEGLHAKIRETLTELARARREAEVKCLEELNRLRESEVPSGAEQEFAGLTGLTCSDLDRMDQRNFSKLVDCREWHLLQHREGVVAFSVESSDPELLGAIRCFSQDPFGTAEKTRRWFGIAMVLSQIATVEGPTLALHSPDVEGFLRNFGAIITDHRTIRYDISSDARRVLCPGVGSFEPFWSILLGPDGKSTIKARILNPTVVRKDCLEAMSNYSGLFVCGPDPEKRMVNTSLYSGVGPGVGRGMPWVEMRGPDVFRVLSAVGARIACGGSSKALAAAEPIKGAADIVESIDRELGDSLADALGEASKRTGISRMEAQEKMKEVGGDF